jgi:hypothetical protein
MSKEETKALKSLRNKGYAIAIWYPDEHGLKRPKRLEEEVVQQSWDIIESLKDEESAE